MPFSPQPRKKGIPTGPRDGDKVPSCGHDVFQKACSHCAAAQKSRKAQAEPPAPKSNVIDLPTEKHAISRLRDKIADKAVTDKRFAEKAAFVISSWAKATKKK